MTHLKIGEILGRKFTQTICPKAAVMNHTFRLKQEEELCDFFVAVGSLQQPVFAVVKGLHYFLAAAEDLRVCVVRTTGARRRAREEAKKKRRRGEGRRSNRRTRYILRPYASLVVGTAGSAHQPAISYYYSTAGAGR